MPRLSLWSMVAILAAASHEPAVARALSSPAPLPVPPMQHAPWSAPATSLPEKLVTAAETLFAAGMADPRGCAYRHVRVMLGDPLIVPKQPVDTAGWVLPARAGDDERYAVCWNGLVYPVTSVGDTADLEADVAAMRSDRPSKFVGYRGSPSWRAWEEQRIHPDLPLAVPVCLLLRLGRVGLAEQVWSDTHHRVPFSDGGLDGSDPFNVVADEWFWSLFNGSEHAHTRGDVRLALARLRLYASAWPEAQKQAAARGLEAGGEPWYRQSVVCTAAQPAVDAPLSLLADDERRVAEGPREPLIKDWLQWAGNLPPDMPTWLREPDREALKRKLPDQKARIAALIHEMDQVIGRPGFNGGTWPTSDPVIAMLKAEGDAAAEPLIECFATDRRLTRVRSSYRGAYGVVPVREVALQALSEMWHHWPVVEWEAGESHPKDVEAVRAYWARYGGRPPLERLYAMLADDAAAPDVWLDAVHAIVGRAGWDDRDDDAPPRGPASALPGEALRAHTSPSVSDLLARRAAALARGPSGKTAGPRELNQACEMALLLYRWDPRASLPTMRAAARWVCDWSREPAAGLAAGYRSELRAYPARIAVLRRKLGDQQALGDYAGWFQVREDLLDSDPGTGILMPMWRYPNYPGWRPVLRDLLGAPGADAGDGKGPLYTIYYVLELAASPMESVPAFREFVLAGLADRSPAGWVELREDGSVEPHGRRWQAGDYGRLDDTRPSKPGRLAFRACDALAWKVSGIWGAPRFELWWPQPRRDEAVAACRQFLARYGGSVVYGDDTWHGRQWGPVVAAPSPLGRPATAADVQQGRAVFTLAGSGRVRTCAVGQLPAPAKWKVPTTWHYVRQQYDAQYRATKTDVHPQEGYVVQAEEVLQDGIWHRFYGFVGPTRMARVPAEEIELTGSRR